MAGQLFGYKFGYFVVKNAGSGADIPGGLLKLQS
jgi:hypothetical protein